MVAYSGADRNARTGDRAAEQEGSAYYQSTQHAKPTYNDGAGDDDWSKPGYAGTSAGGSYQNGYRGEKSYGGSNLRDRNGYGDYRHESTYSKSSGNYGASGFDRKPPRERNSHYHDGSDYNARSGATRTQWEPKADRYEEASYTYQRRGYDVSRDYNKPAYTRGDQYESKEYAKGDPYDEKGYATGHYDSKALDARGRYDRKGYAGNEGYEGPRGKEGSRYGESSNKGGIYGQNEAGSGYPQDHRNSGSYQPAYGGSGKYGGTRNYEDGNKQYRGYAGRGYGGRGDRGDTYEGRGDRGDTHGGRGDRGDSYGGREDRGDTYGRRGDRGESYGGRGDRGNTYGGRGYGSDSYGGRGDRDDTYGARGSKQTDYDWDNFRNDKYGGGSDVRRGNYRTDEDLWADATADVDVNKVVKDCYIETPIVSSMTDEQVAAYREEKLIQVNDPRCPKPIPSFDAAPFPAEIVKWLKKFPSPTSVQAQGWPIAMSGYNMIARAVTGSGKTLGFGLPGLMHIKAQLLLNPDVEQERRGPMVLVVSPTRELATQIETELTEPAMMMGVRMSLIIGGDSHNLLSQKSLIRERPHFLVGCPGRLGHLVKDGVLNLSAVSYWVLDEADRMLDMGFSRDIEGLNRCIRADRQVLLWSATWPREVDQFAKTIFPAFAGLHDVSYSRVIDKDGAELTDDPYAIPIYLKIGRNETQVVETIRYEFKFCPTNNDYDSALIERVRPLVSRRALIFCNKKSDCGYVMGLINSCLKTHRAEAIHGDKSQSQREKVLDEFKQGIVNVLVATDVMARGIDVRGIEEVINYEMPKSLETFVHRTGRTARAGCSGTAYSLVGRFDNVVMEQIGLMLRDNGHDMQSYKECMSQGFKTHTYVPNLEQEEEGAIAAGTTYEDDDPWAKVQNQTGGSQWDEPYADAKGDNEDEGMMDTRVNTDDVNVAGSYGNNLGSEW